jgi:hypothetical protein
MPSYRGLKLDGVAIEPLLTSTAFSESDVRHMIEQTGVDQRRPHF